MSKRNMLGFEVKGRITVMEQLLCFLLMLKSVYKAFSCFQCHSL